MHLSIPAILNMMYHKLLLAAFCLEAFMQHTVYLIAYHYSFHLFFSLVLAEGLKWGRAIGVST